MVLAVQDGILVASDHDQVRVVGVTSRETKVDVEFVGDSTDAASSAADNARMYSVVDLDRLAV